MIQLRSTLTHSRPFVNSQGPAHARHSAFLEAPHYILGHRQQPLQIDAPSSPLRDFGKLPTNKTSTICQDVTEGARVDELSPLFHQREGLTFHAMHSLSLPPVCINFRWSWRSYLRVPPFPTLTHPAFARRLRVRNPKLVSGHRQAKTGIVSPFPTSAFRHSLRSEQVQHFKLKTSAFSLIQRGYPDD